MNETNASFVPIETATETASLTPLPVPAASLESASGMAQSSLQTRKPLSNKPSQRP